MMEFVRLTPEQAKARRRRNVFLALALGGFILLVFAISVAKMKAGMSP